MACYNEWLIDRSLYGPFMDLDIGIFPLIGLLTMIKENGHACPKCRWAHSQVIFTVHRPIYTNVLKLLWARFTYLE